jgi:hypothetical protein
MLSALPAIADIGQAFLNVRVVPIADIRDAVQFAVEATSKTQNSAYSPLRPCRNTPGRDAPYAGLTPETHHINRTKWAESRVWGRVGNKELFPFPARTQALLDRADNGHGHGIYRPICRRRGRQASAHSLGSALIPSPPCRAC